MPFFLDRFQIEILHEIFKYLLAHEILHLFYNISDRLDHILLNYKNYSINFQSIRKSDFDLVCRLIRPEQVISLILSDDSETPHQSKLFLSRFSIQQFTRLQALKLIEPNGDDHLLCSYLYKIPNLVSLEIDVGIDFPSIKTGPSLKKLIINTPSDVHFDVLRRINNISVEQLRHVSLLDCPVILLQYLFHHAPQLTTLKTSLLLFEPEEIHIFTRIHQGRSTTLALVSLSLSVHMPGEFVTRDYFESLLSSLQCLRQLELIVHGGVQHPFLNAQGWEKFLVKYLPKLKTFDFKFSSIDIDEKILDPFRSPFWINKKWFVAIGLGGSLLFTVPCFAPTTISDSSPPISSDCTTLPLEQHHVFYDRITQLRFQTDQWNLPFRYNHVKELILDDPYTKVNIVDLSKVQLLVVKTSEWSLLKIVLVIKKAMPSVNHLRLICNYPSESHKYYFPDISLPQIRKLSLPQYGEYKGKDKFNWNKVFPCVERLTASINSKHQIVFLIEHFKSIISGSFFIGSNHLEKSHKIKVTHEWLKKHSCRLKTKTANNFICQINNRYFFSMSFWIDEKQ
ncbi:unnamed protein product [Rotaria sp. Silwood1]|nr:unnamed protein product [Rotaria sp. Silwood1]